MGLSQNSLEAAANDGLYVSTRGGVARLVLDREGGNRFSYALTRRFGEVLRALAAEPTLRAVLLTAEGPDFSFGADLSDGGMANRVAGSRADRVALAGLGQEALDAWATLPIPTLAAARGRIIGAGACFFCTADFSFASPDATVQFPEVDRGMHLSWGVIPRLVARYGLAHATNLAMLGAPVACGQLPQPPMNLADNPLAAAETLAENLATKPPLAVRAIKRVLMASAAAIQHAAGSDAELFADTVGSADFAEAMAAWFEKRPGKYTAT